jgi:hypothetical protein
MSKYTGFGPMVNFTDFKKWEDLVNFSFAVKLQFTFELIWTLNKTVMIRLGNFYLVSTITGSIPLLMDY